jgi:protein-L-isoaspartate O-methyltransferase
MGRFASTVAYYESARPPYGEAFFAEVARRLAFDGSQRLIDVGTGPGILAIGFAPFVREALGVEAEPAMIAAARAAAKRAGAAVEFIEARFEDLPTHLGEFDVVTIGRAIHWLDPSLAPARLDRMVAPGGKILVCHAGSVDDGRNRWLERFNAIHRQWKDDRPLYDRDTFFAGRRFKPRETITVEATYFAPVERFADRVLSMSTSSPQRLGDEVPIMRAAMREALAPFALNGMIEDVVEARAEVFEGDSRETRQRQRLSSPEPPAPRLPPLRRQRA